MQVLVDDLVRDQRVTVGVRRDADLLQAVFGGEQILQERVRSFVRPGGLLRVAGDDEDRVVALGAEPAGEPLDVVLALDQAGRDVGDRPMAEVADAVRQLDGGVEALHRARRHGDERVLGEGFDAGLDRLERDEFEGHAFDELTAVRHLRRIERRLLVFAEQCHVVAF